MINYSLINRKLNQRWKIGMLTPQKCAVCRFSDSLLLISGFGFYVVTSVSLIGGRFSIGIISDKR